MARKVRDYRAEREKRIARGIALGLTRSQASGHPKKGEISASLFFKRKKYTTEQKYHEVIRIVREGKTLTSARKEIGLSREAFIRQNEKFRSFTKEEMGRYLVKPGHFSFIDASGRLHERVPFAGKNVAIMREYEDAYEAAVMTGKSAPLKQFRKEILGDHKLADADGNRVTLATDINTIKKALKTADAERAASFAEGLYEPSEVMG